MQLSSAQAASAERLRFERRVLDAGPSGGALVLNIFNITLGPRMDELMPLVAAHVAERVRTSDQVCRIGLQHLGIVVDTSYDDLDAIAERLEDSVEQTKFELRGKEFWLHAAVSHATNAEAGPESPLLLALDRNHARVQHHHRRIFHNGPYNGGHGGSACNTIAEWAELSVASSVDPEQFGCEGARFEFDGVTREAGVIPDRAPEFQIEIEVGQQVRGRMTSWNNGTPTPPAFLHSCRAYFNEVCERLVALEASRLDDLTGLVNRAGLRHRLDQQHVHAIALVDLDHFKSINDTHGYATGDRVLCLAASVLEERCAPAVVARWGGEEFVVATDRDVSWLADRLASALDECRQLSVISDRPVTFSAGVAAVDANDWLIALPTVNEALHRAKGDRATVLAV